MFSTKTDSIDRFGRETLTWQRGANIGSSSKDPSLHSHTSHPPSHQATPIWISDHIGHASSIVMPHDRGTEQLTPTVPARATRQPGPPNSLMPRARGAEARRGSHLGRERAPARRLWCAEGAGWGARGPPEPAISWLASEGRVGVSLWGAQRWEGSHEEARAF